MKNLKLLPYKMGSESCKNIARELDSLRVFPDRAYRPKPNHVVLNWGMARNPWPDKAFTWINKPERVAVATNKVAAFQQLATADVSIPQFTTSKDEALTWYATKPDQLIYVRHNVSTYGGRGIELANNRLELEESRVAPLYTKGITCRREYRVHVFNGVAIDVTRKAKTIDREGEPDNLIRNHENGWIFQRNDFEIPAGLKELGVQAVAALGLDFGAVDVIAEKNTGKLYVLEINCAPGAEGTTVTKYVDAVRDYMEGR